MGIIYATSGRSMAVKNLSWKCSMACRDNYSPIYPVQEELMISLRIYGIYVYSLMYFSDERVGGTHT